MANFLLLIFCFLLGIALRVGRVVDDRGPVVLNAVVIYMSLPALAVLYAHSLPLSFELLVPASMAWIVFGMGCVFFHLMGKIFGLDNKTVACLCICGGLGNTSFVGLPMIEALFGTEYLGVGMLCDMAGTFMVLAIPGIMLAAKASGQSVEGRALALKVLLFPPFLAIVLGFALQPIPYPVWFESALTRLGGTLAPLALISVGMALRFKDIKHHVRELGLGLCYKMFMAPALMLLLYVEILDLTDMTAKVTVFEAAMGPMITGGIIAMTYGLRPRLAASLLGVGIPLSFVTLPLWHLILISL